MQHSLAVRCLLIFIAYSFINKQFYPEKSSKDQTYIKSMNRTLEIVHFLLYATLYLEILLSQESDKR